MGTGIICNNMNMSWMELFNVSIIRAGSQALVLLHGSIYKYDHGYIEYR